MRKIYLAVPYSHAVHHIREMRVAQVDAKAAELMEAGNLVFSPISHSHPISKYTSKDPQDHAFWLEQDFWILRICDEVHVLCLEGWEKSYGVGAEIDEAERLGLRIEYHYYINGQRI